MVNFNIWLEERIRADDIRKTMLDYLGLDPQINMSITIGDLGERTKNEIMQKIKNWDSLTDNQKTAAIKVLFDDKTSLSELANAISGAEQSF